MKTVSLASILCVLFNLRLINGQFDGQFSCAFGNHRNKRETATSIFASSSVSKKKVKFLLNRKEQYDGNFSPIDIIAGNVMALQYAGFDPSKLTKVFIHGYKSDQNKSSSILIRQGFFKNGDFNFIMIDWSAAQHQYFGVLWPYDAVIKKLDAVGRHVSNMLLFLEDNGLDLSTTTVIGHSLGAHVAGIAGYNLNGRIGRIVGLDPAGPLISERRMDERLSKDDAVQVEIIHSEIEQCGLKNQMGHYDFYPNSGNQQPGCTTNKCSHARSYRFFAESLDPNSKGFYGRLCDDWIQMQQGNCNGDEVLMGGLDTKTAPHGIYYVSTNDEAPFARGHQ